MNEWNIKYQAQFDNRSDFLYTLILFKVEYEDENFKILLQAAE